MALEPREAEIRGWVEQGRSDARIGEKLGTSAASIQRCQHPELPLSQLQSVATCSWRG
jgi:hypothetical protein